MKQQQRMKIRKDLTKKIRSKGRMDAENRLWVTDLLAADCEEVWIHPGWEDTKQKWCEWLEKVNKEDEKKKMEEMHQQKVTQMIMRELLGSCTKSRSLQPAEEEHRS